MGNITLVGRLQDYAGKAVDSLYKTAGRIANPILDTIAGVDFAGSYFNNSSIPEYTKFQALHRNIITDDSAIAQIGGEFPAPGKKMELGWKDFWKIAAAVGVLSAAGGGYAYMKKKDFGMDDVDSGIAYAKAEILGSSLFSFMNEPPVADLKIDTPQKDWISGEKIVFNASKSSDDKGIAKYEWRVDGEKTITSEPKLEQNFSEGSHLVDLTVYDKEGKSAQMGVGVEVKRPYDYYDKDLKTGFYIEGVSPEEKQNIINLMQTWKDVDLPVYSEMVGKYYPTKIVKSRDSGWSWYDPINDAIELPEALENFGGSDDLQTRKEALPILYGEFRNVMLQKTGTGFTSAGNPSDEYNININGSILNQESGRFKYAAKIGLITEEQANAYIESVSERLKNGTYKK